MFTTKHGSFCKYCTDSKKFCCVVKQASGNKVSRKTVLCGSQNIVLNGKVIVQTGAIIRGDLSNVRTGRYCVISQKAVIRPAYKQFSTGYVFFIAFEIRNTNIYWNVLLLELHFSPWWLVNTFTLAKVQSCQLLRSVHMYILAKMQSLWVFCEQINLSKRRSLIGIYITIDRDEGARFEIAVSLKTELLCLQRQPWPVLWNSQPKERLKVIKATYALCHLQCKI